MSIFNCHKQEPQPWMSYIAPVKICFSGDCCPVLVTDNYSLLPFQIISEGDYIRSEISVYGSGVWTEITVPVTSVITEGFYIHTYNGETLAEELECGAYEFRVIAGETWWFEPFTVETFEFYENAYHKRDLLMLPFKFSDQQFETLPLIAPCDSFLPFMFTTENPTTGTPQYYLYDVINDCEVVELTDIVVTVLTIDGRTYYIHEGECLSMFLDCGLYKIEIVDGDHSYFSVPFDVECGLNDIPDGYRAMRDFNGCVMRDDDGEIMYSACTSLTDIDGNAYTSTVINGQEWIIENFRVTHYADGTEIPYLSNNALWAADNVGAYGYYNGDGSYIMPYGLLYNWYAVDNARGLAYMERNGSAEAGWRVASETDYNNLITYLGTDPGVKVKEANSPRWLTTNATNETGFRAVGGGLRQSNGVYIDLRITGNLWSSDSQSMFLLEAISDGFYNDNYTNNYGFSVRLVRDI